MAVQRVCDKCGEFMEQRDPLAGEVPDLFVAIQGRTVVEMVDLCDDCQTKVKTNIDRYINVKSRKRGRKTAEVAEQS